MKALGDHVILRMPPKRETTEGGIIVSQIDQQRVYGRILSVGKQADTNMGDWKVGGDIAVFDPNGVIALDVDPAGTKAPEVAVHYTNILAVMDDGEATKLGIPIP